MAAQRRHESLARHYLRWFGALAAAVAALIVLAVLGFVLLPLSARSSDDLAGLMVLSAQTWVELPPQTRPAFEAELLAKHRLALRPGEPLAGDQQVVHGFYLGFLERALQERGGDGRLVRGAGPEGDDWLWSALQAGGQPIAVGFARERISARPLSALAFVGLAGALLVWGASAWLARRVAQPVQRLEQAAARMAAGADPMLLPEAGPRELADLARHFNRMALQVRELVDARTTLLAGVSHDLRTPLARMRLAIEMLTLKPGPELVARLERDIEEMNALIGQLLTLARGMSPEGRRTLLLSPWLQERAALAPSAGSTIEIECPGDLQVEVAPGILARIVDNLLGNALRYAPGAIELRALQVQDAAGAKVRIAVRDRGPGIPQDQIDRIWRPFHRVEGSRSPSTGGYGLGLAVVHQLARAQGWQVGAAAREGGGLEVWVEIGEGSG